MRHLDSIEAITLDVGGTLLQPWPSVGHVYAQFATRYGATNVTPELLKRRFVNAWKELEHFNHTRDEWAALVDETFRGLTDPLPSRTFFSELYDYFGHREAWRLFDDVLPLLKTLAAQGTRLGIISNWDDRLRPLLREFELTDYFEVMVISCEIGHCKPAAVLFEKAATMLRVRPGSILHVGDSRPHDFDGARAAGFQSLLLERSDGSLGSIQSLTEICSRVGNVPAERDTRHSS